MLVGFATVAFLAAQETRTYTGSSVDGSGNRVDGPAITESRSKAAFERTEKQQSVNGRMVPRERIEERVIRDDSTGREVERIVQKFDATGNPGPLEKTLTEERKVGDRLTVSSTVYRGDLNGNLQVSERSVIETLKTGSGQHSDIVIERPSINGAMETVERKSVEKMVSGDRYQENATTFRRGANGFYPASRIVTDHSQAKGEATESSAEYGSSGSGALELQGQTVTRTTKRADGSELSVVDVFGLSTPGTVQSRDAGLQLKERELVDRKPGAGGSVVETVSLQRPSVSDPGVLGPARVVSETVCRGTCK